MNRLTKPSATTPRGSRLVVLDSLDGQTATDREVHTGLLERGHQPTKLVEQILQAVGD